MNFLALRAPQLLFNSIFFEILQIGGISATCINFIKPILSYSAFQYFPLISLIPSILYKGRNKRWPKKANHGTRPCNHVARRLKRPRRWTKHN